MFTCASFGSCIESNLFMNGEISPKIDLSNLICITKLNPPSTLFQFSQHPFLKQLSCSKSSNDDEKASSFQPVMIKLNRGFTVQMTWSIFYNTTSYTTFIGTAAVKHFGFFLGTNLSGIINNKKDSSNWWEKEKASIQG